MMRQLYSRSEEAASFLSFSTSSEDSTYIVLALTTAALNSDPDSWPLEVKPQSLCGELQC